MTHLAFVPDDSRLAVHASSSLHGIDADAAGVEGALDLELAPDGSIDLSAPVGATLTFELARLSSGNPLNDAVTEKRLDVRRYPLVEATLTSIEAKGAGDEPGTWRYGVRGELTLHGVTQPLEGEIGFRAGAGGRTVQIWGEQVIDVRAWKIKPPTLGLIKVHPDVRVRLDAVARRSD
jgi:polyisoprenoid-binding protein YceI